MTTHEFIQTYRTLQEKTPRIANLSFNSENSLYTNYSFWNKNCYLCYGTHYCEECFYMGYSNNNTDCCDCEDVEKSELLYECVLCDKSYNCSYGGYLFACSDTDYSWDLVNCSSCFLCTSLQNQSYCILNKKLSQAEFETERKRLLEDYTAGELLQQLDELRTRVPQRCIFQKNCEWCIGPDLRNCKNVIYSFAAKNSEDCIYTARHVKNTTKVGLSVTTMCLPLRSILAF